MNEKEKYLEKEVLKNEFITFLEHMPHNSTLCGLLTDRMVKKAKPQDRPELLQLIVEKFHFAPSAYSGTPYAHYDVNMDIFLKEEFQERVNSKIISFIDTALKAEPVETREVFYEKLYNYIFENEEFTKIDQQAYVLYICCRNPMLPYYEMEVKDLKDMDLQECIGEEISDDKIMRVDFIVNNPIFNCFEKAALLNKEIEMTPASNRDILIAHVVEFYECKLKTERTIRELNTIKQSFNCPLRNDQQLIPSGISTYRPRRYRKKRRKYIFQK